MRAESATGGGISPPSAVLDAPAAAGLPPIRLSGLDATRFIAAVVIVGFHTMPYPLAGVAAWVPALQELALKWAVPFFFAASGFLHARSKRSGSTAWLGERMVRLGVPYLLWTTLRLIDLHPITLATLFAQYVLCAPTSTLWFVWTLLLMTLLAWLARRAGMRSGPLLLAATIAALAQSTIAQFWQSAGALGQVMHEYPWYAYQSPLLWLWVYAAGMFLAEYGWLERPARARHAWTWGALLGIVTIVVVRFALGGLDAQDFAGYHFAFGWLGLWQGAYGVVALLLALSWSPGGAERWRYLGSLALGIYLVHPALLRVLKLAPNAPVVHTVLGAPALLWAVLAALSTVIVAIVIQVPGLRRFVV